MFKNNYHRNKFVAMFLIMLLPFMGFATRMVADEDGAGNSEHEQILLEKVKEETGKALKAEMKKFSEGQLTKDEFKEQIGKLETDINKFSDLSTSLDLIKTTLTEMDKIQKAQGDLINQNKSKVQPDGKVLTKKDVIQMAINKALMSDEYKAFIDGGMNGKSKKVTLTKEEIQNKVVSIASDYTGTVLISEASGRVIDVPNRAINVRDLINITNTDQPNIVGQEVNGWSDAFTASATELAENESAPEGSFDVVERTWGIKRIAAFIDMSKRMLKSNGLRWLSNHLVNVLPMKLKYVEDWNLLYGDGLSDRVVGLENGATTIDLSGAAYIAGAFSAAATYKAGTKTLVTFTAAHGMRNGDSLTIANSANYNETYTGVIVVSATQIIIDATYVAEATGAWTGQFRNPFYQSIDEAQEFDVLRVAASYMAYKERTVDGIIAHPNDAAKIDLLKGTDARYVGISRNAQGILTVMGIPVIETTAVAAGKFFIGSFGSQFVELAEFSPLSVSFHEEDATYLKTNKVLVLVEEEIIFPIFEPLAFGYGVFSTLKTQLETP